MSENEFYQESPVDEAAWLECKTALRPQWFINNTDKRAKIDTKSKPL